MQGADGISISGFESYQGFHPAVLLHVVQVHGKQLQQKLPPLQRTGNLPGQFLFWVPISCWLYGVQVGSPRFVLLLEQSQEDLLLRLKVVVDGGPGKGGECRDLLDGDLLETHCLIQLGAGIDDLLSPGLGQCLGTFRHILTPFAERTGTCRSHHRSAGIDKWGTQTAPASSSGS